MEIKQLKTSDLVLDPSNARKHSPKNIEAIKASLAKFGQQKPIVVDKNMVVVAGNGTLVAARALGWDTIACVNTDLSQAELIAYGIADNRTAELASWDKDELPRLMKGLADEDRDLALATGFNDDEVTALLNTLTREDRFAEQAAAASQKESDDAIPGVTDADADDSPARGERNSEGQTQSYFESLQPVIQYNIVFENVDQQERFYAFMKSLKVKYQACDTFAGRFDQYLRDHHADLTPPAKLATEETEARDEVG